MKNYKVIVNGTAYEVSVEEISAAEVKSAPTPAAPAQSSAAASSPVSTFNDNDDDAFSEIVNFFKK